MTQVKTIGLDLAKHVFHLVALDERGHEIHRKMLRRSRVLSYFAQQPSCLVAMEACAGAHYWGRELEKAGHRVHLIPAQHVKPFVRGNKHDYNDARAIAEAVNRPGMACVAIKTVALQDLQALLRLREGCVKERTAHCNRLHGLLGEYGIVVRRGVNVLRRRLPELLEETDNGLSPLCRRLLGEEYQQLCELDAHIKRYTQELKALVKADERCQWLQTAPGYGPILACAYRCAIGDGSGYRRGRDVSAAVGIVPRQHSTGGKPVLLGISKRGDPYLRSLLIHGARSVVVQAARKDDPLSRWINRIRAERGFNKAVVAMANKMARIGWALLRHQTTYQPG